MFEGADLSGAIFSKANFDYLDRKELITLLAHLCAQKATIEDDQAGLEETCPLLSETKKIQTMSGPR